MKLVSENPKISTRQIAIKVGISNGSAYYLLNALIKKGFVKFENFLANPSKGRYVYLLTPKGIREKYKLTFRFLERKKKEFKQLKKEISMLENESKSMKTPKTFTHQKKK